MDFMLLMYSCTSGIYFGSFGEFCLRSQEKLTFIYFMSLRQKVELNEAGHYS